MGPSYCQQPEPMVCKYFFVIRRPRRASVPNLFLSLSTILKTWLKTYSTSTSAFVSAIENANKITFWFSGYFISSASFISNIDFQYFLTQTYCFSLSPLLKGDLLKVTVNCYNSL